MTNVSRKGSLFLILEIWLPWPKCIQQIFSALVMSIQANYKKKNLQVSQGAFQCGNFLMNCMHSLCQHNKVIE